MRFKFKQGDELSSEARAVAHDICSGSRGEVPAPLRAWLVNPNFASMSQQLGDYLRFNSSLPKKLSELSILCVAHHWGSPFEWEVHKVEALKVGLEEHIIVSIHEGGCPLFESKTESLVFSFCSNALNKKAIDSNLFEQLRESIGEKGVMDLIGIMGYYTLISLTLNTLEIDADSPSLHREHIDLSTS
jgi:4-carboxymuconolactone decarboxylase